ncbi:MAG: LUD domain-containing protein [Pseudomonadota bacterium]|nr:LUD domain-containing protein [Pseudomonadota bacterium]
MSDARNSILTAIRAAQADHRSGSLMLETDRIAAESERLRRRVAGTRPDRLGGGPEEAFLERLVSPAVAATAERVGTLGEFPAAVRRYLAAQGLGASVSLQPHPHLLALDWSRIECHGHIGHDEPVAVGLALGAIAETGTLVFHSGPTSPTLFAFLPIHHIVAVEARNIWGWLEDYADAVAAQAPPRNVNLITGASGTTDIEGTLVRGAHGPNRLHIVLIGGTPRGPEAEGAPSRSTVSDTPARPTARTILETE